jgi:hypothetical protein
MKRDRIIHGIYAETLQGKVKFSTRADADTMAFTLESPEGITQMLQILGDFVQWSRMEVKLSKCATAFDILSEER